MSIPTGDVRYLRRRDGVRVAYRRWLPAGEVRGVVQLVHGGLRRSGRHAPRLATALTRARLAAYSIELGGQGRTAEGVRAGPFGVTAGRPAHAAVLDDVEAVHLVAADRHPGVPRVLVGHSMGAVIALAAAERRGAHLAGLVLSGPLGPTAEPADPLTGADALPQPSGAARFWAAAASSTSPGAIADLPDGLPVLLLTGLRDPEAREPPAQVTVLAGLLADRGLPVDQHSYPEPGHGLFDQTDQVGVLADLVAWLDARF